MEKNILADRIQDGIEYWWIEKEDVKEYWHCQREYKMEKNILADFGR